MDQSRRIINNSIYLYAKMCITIFISLYTVRLLLSALGVVDYGVYNVIGGMVAIFGFLNSSMAMVTQRFMSYHSHDKVMSLHVFNMTVVIHFLIAIFTLILLESILPLLFDKFINIPEDRIDAGVFVYHVTAITTALMVMTVPYEAVLNAHENMSYFSIVGLFESLMKLLVAFVVVYTLADKLYIYALCTLGQTFVVLFIMLVYCHRKYAECKFSFRNNWDISLFKEMSSFLGWNFLNQFSLIVSGNGINLILNHFFGPVLNAAQSVAQQIRGQSQALSASLQKAFTPVIAKSEGEGNREKMIYSTLCDTRYTTFMFLVIGVPLFLYTEEILNLWLETVPEWAVLFVKYVMVMALLERLFYPLVLAIQAEGTIKGYLVWNTLLNLLQMPVLYVAFSQGATPDWLFIIQMVVGNLLTLIPSLYYAHKNCGFTITRIFADAVVPLSVCAIIAVMVGNMFSFIVEPQSLVVLIISVVLVDFVLTIIFYLWGMKKNEREQIISFAKLHLTKG